MTSYPARNARRAAFTLIELLTVMAIILLLAGLVLGLAGLAQRKAAEARAKSEIEALATAANVYQADNGTYPRTADTDTLDAQNVQKYSDPVGAGPPTYSTTSQALYRMLSGTYYFDSNGTLQPWSKGSAPQPTVYYPFKTSQLKNSGNITSGYIAPNLVTGILDPFGLSYGYSTAYQADVDANTAAGTNVTPTHGYNPTYDLWSTAGYSPSGGKAYPTDIATAKTQNTLWIKNW